MNRLLFSFVLTVALAAAQPVGFGVKGGIPLTDLFSGSQQGANIFQSETDRFIVGPMVELRLPFGLAVEGDALYSRTNLSSLGAATGSAVQSVTDANSWEFPITLKKKFGGAKAVGASLRPYIGAGVSFRHITGLSNLPNYITGSSGGSTDPNNTGFVIEGGLEVKVLFLRLSPELRFTRWGSENFTQGLENFWKTNRNQGQFLVGIHF